MVVPFYISTHSIWVNHCSTFSPTFGIVNSFFFNSYAYLWFVVLICISLVTNGIEHVCICSFIYFIWWSVFSKNFPNFLIGLFVLLCPKSPLYILPTNTLSAICFANILSQSMTCLFIFLTVSFEEQAFYFLKSNLSFFLFLWFMFLWKSRITRGKKIFFLCFLLQVKKNWLLHLGNLFELNFGYGVKRRLTFPLLFLYVNIQFFGTICWKESLFHPETHWYLFGNRWAMYVWVHFWTHYFDP